MEKVLIKNRYLEIGIKFKPLKALLLNFAVFVFASFTTAGILLGVIWIVAPS